MGLDVHGLKFLSYELRKGSFGDVATLGRQRIHVPPYWLHRILPAAKTTYDGYCEALLHDHFGATKVESFDYSDYEGATHIADMNQPIAPPGQYDTIIDAGTLEHVFDIVRALTNASALCKPGGRILHMLPANNFCGHGFWQFSPEVFFSLYSGANGYSGTRIFLADLSNWNTWYECKIPSGSRAEFRSVGSSPLHILVRTQKTGQISHHDVQQSDYISAWQATGSGAPKNKSFKDKMKNSPLWPKARQIVYMLRRIRGSEHLIRRTTRELAGC